MSHLIQKCIDQQSFATITRQWNCMNCNMRDFIGGQEALKESIMRLAQFAMAEMRGDAAIQLRGPVRERHQALLLTIADIENCENSHRGLVEPVTLQRVCYLREYVRKLVRETEDVLAGRRPKFRMLRQVLQNPALIGGA